jgi:cytochrome c oxidase subunit 2
MRMKAVVAILAGAVLVLGAWAWAQHDAAAQQQMGPAGQGMMGSGGMMGGQAPQGGAGQGTTGGPVPQGGPGATPGAMGSQGGQPVGPGGTWGPHGYGMQGWQGGTEIPLFERPLISQMLAVRDQLALTEQQVQRLEKLRTDYEKDAIRRTSEIQIAEVDLSQLLTSSSPEMAKVEAQVKKIATLEADLRLARIKALEAGKAVVSQEQWQKFESLAPGFGPMRPYGGPGPYGQHGPGAYGPYGMMPGGMGPWMMGGYGAGMMGSGGMMGGSGPYGGSTPQQFTSNGQQIYFTGVSRQDGYLPRTGGPPWAQRVGCAACHGPNGRGGSPVMMGTAIPPDIRYDVLTGKVPEASGEKMDHPPYTDATIKQAITQGVDPANKPLDWTMPRWQMSAQDLNDLLAYLKTLR